MLNNLEDPVQTPAQALKNALILAITAETDERSEECVKMAKGFAHACSDETVDRIKKEIEELLSRSRFKECEDCDGVGWVETEYARPQNFDRDIGCLDTRRVDCETCHGNGEVEIDDG